MRDIEIKNNLEKISVTKDGQIIFLASEWNKFWKINVLNRYEKIEKSIIETTKMKGVKLLKAFRIVDNKLGVSKIEFYEQYKKAVASGKIILRKPTCKIRCASCKKPKPDNEIIGKYCEECVFHNNGIHGNYMKKNKYEEDDELDY